MSTFGFNNSGDSLTIKGSTAAVDPAQYRGGTLTGMPYTTVPVLSVNRGVTFAPIPASGAPINNNPSNFAALYKTPIPRDVGKSAMRKGGLGAQTVVAHVGEVQALGPNTDQVTAVTHNMSYNYTGNGPNQVQQLDARPSFRVAPRLDDTKVSILRTSPTIESAAKDLGLKLPRIFATDDPAAAQGPNIHKTYSEFERLRGFVAEDAMNEDYGQRLSQLAKIVLHAYTAAQLGLNHDDSDVQAVIHVKSLVVAELPLLRATEYDKDVFVYLDCDTNVEYQAFHIMGLAGLENYVGMFNRTVYSNMVGSNELKTGGTVRFVQLTGDRIMTAPTPQAFAAVLNKPKACLAFYNAYASTLGILDKATSVLRQMSILPFMHRETAILPYAARLTPKADAYVYLLADLKSLVGQAEVDAVDMVLHARFLAEQILVGCGAIMASYQYERKTAAVEVHLQVLKALDSHVTSTATVQATLMSIAHCTGDLEWVNPFAAGASLGADMCTNAYRRSAWIMGSYASMVLPAFTPLFSTGVDMRNIDIAHQSKNSTWKEAAILNEALGLPWRYMSETQFDSLSLNALRDLDKYRRWKAAIQFIRVVAPTAEPVPELNYMNPTPIDNTQRTVPSAQVVAPARFLEPPDLAQLFSHRAKPKTASDAGTLTDTVPPEYPASEASTTRTITQRERNVRRSSIVLTGSNLKPLQLSPNAEPQHPAQVIQAEQTAHITQPTQKSKRTMSAPFNWAEDVEQVRNQHSRSRSPSVASVNANQRSTLRRMFQTEQPKPKVSRTPSPARSVPSVVENSFAVQRGALQSSEIKMVAKNAGTMENLRAAVQNVKTGDGKLALAKTLHFRGDKFIAGEILEAMEPGALGTLPSRGWTRQVDAGDGTVTPETVVKF